MRLYPFDKPIKSVYFCFVCAFSFQGHTKIALCDSSLSKSVRRSIIPLYKLLLNHICEQTPNPVWFGHNLTKGRAIFNGSNFKKFWGSARCTLVKANTSGLLSFKNCHFFPEFVQHTLTPPCLFLYTENREFKIRGHDGSENVA